MTVLTMVDNCVDHMVNDDRVDNDRSFRSCHFYKDNFAKI